jgi:hypothetical protein
MLGGDRGCARASPRHDSVGESVLLYVSTKPTEPTTQIGLETDWGRGPGQGGTGLWASQGCQHPQKVFGRGRREHQPFPADGMHKAEQSGMERLMGQGRRRKLDRPLSRRLAVQGIAQDGEALLAQVDPDLVGAAGFQAQLDHEWPRGVAPAPDSG